MKYQGDLRRVYIEHPRVRLDGVYIAVCHYVCVHVLMYLLSYNVDTGSCSRPGFSESAWVNVRVRLTRVIRLMQSYV